MTRHNNILLTNRIAAEQKKNTKVVAISDPVKDGFHMNAFTLPAGQSGRAVRNSGGRRRCKRVGVLGVEGLGQ